MEKNNKNESRCSLNMTQAAQPIAESTRASLNGSRATAQFQWGASALGPHNLSRSNSSGNLTNGGLGNTSQLHSPSRLRTKIDPKIYADVQSKGLAARIVKYHESGSNLKRSMSMSNIASKFGQFPVVHLQKVELPYKATKAKVSMTRIPPPERSIFHGNTVPSLLRSNSVVGLQKSNEDISRENRPIIHPPPTENDLEPTRSVLEVLKEISRKRISNDDSDSSGVMKKYCSRDKGQVGDENRLRPVEGNQISGSAKRQRESAQVSYPLATPSSTGAMYVNQDFSLRLPETGRSQQSQTSPQNSPEQQAKRRMCNNNNDIISSLSSSSWQATKRKLSEQQKGSCGAGKKTYRAGTSVDEDYEAYKQRTEQGPKLPPTGGSKAPITPLPETPIIQSVEIIRSNTFHSIIPQATRQANAEVETVAPPPMRTASEPTFTRQQCRSAPVVNKSQKPRLTLFDQDYPEASSESTNRKDSLDVEEFGDCAGVEFVKPIKSVSKSAMENPIMERTRKSKLALMLSSLRGEVYQGEDESDSPKNKGDIATSMGVALSASNAPATTNTFGSSTTIGLTTNTTTTTVTTTKPSIIGINALAAQKEAETALSSKGPPTILSTAKSMPVASGIAPTTKAMPVASGITTTTTTAIVLTTTTTAATTTTSSTPIQGGFKFPTPQVSSSVAATSATTRTTTSNSVKSPLVGIKLSAPAPNAVFGGNASNASGTSAGLPSSGPTLGGFSFGKANNVTTTTATNTLPGTAGFSFGLATPNASTTATTTAAATAPSFSGFQVAPLPTTATTNATATLNFNAPSTTSSTAQVMVFGRPQAPTTTATTTAAVSPFGQTLGAAALPTTTTQASANPTFGSFSSPSSKPFTFGSPAPPATTAMANAFGGNSTMSVNTNNNAQAAFGSNTFAFGSGTTAPPSTSTTTPASKPFSFGAMQTPQTSANTAVATTTPSSKAFTFGGGGNSMLATTTNSGSSGGASKPFAFGGGATTSKPTNNSFAFGASTNSNSDQQKGSSMFGNAATNAFGTTTNSNSTANTASSAKPFTFGSTTNNAAASTFGGSATFGGKLANATAGGGAFSFGGTPNKGNTVPTTTISSNNVFGSGMSNATNKPNTFTFGGGGGTASPSAANGTKSIFGNISMNSQQQAQQPASTSKSIFGNASTNTQQQQQQPANTSSNLFASAASKLSSGGGGFAFGGSTTPNKPTGVATLNVNFGFGGANSGNNQSAAATGPPKTFSFGGGGNNASTGAPTAPSTTNIFGGGSNTLGNTATPFGFSAQGTAPQTNGPSPNLFAPGPGDRPIRKATRRLQKS